MLIVFSYNPLQIAHRKLMIFFCLLNSTRSAYLWTLRMEGVTFMKCVFKGSRREELSSRLVSKVLRVLLHLNPGDPFTSLPSAAQTQRATLALLTRGHEKETTQQKWLEVGLGSEVLWKEGRWESEDLDTVFH